MGEPPLVSIAMAMRNSERTLRPALHSILRQRYAHWELILLDDGSTDGSARLATAVDDPRVRLVVDGRWRGLPARLNQAVAMARGKYLARMDADDVAYPGRLERQVAFLEQNPEVDLVGVRALAFDDTGRPLGLFPLRTDHLRICTEPWVGFYLPHPTWMGRIEWFKRFGYREDAIRCEDQDLLLRAHRLSRYACMPEVLLGYRQAGVSMRNSLLGRANYLRGLWRYAGATGRWYWALRGTATQTYRAAATAAALWLGLEGRLLARRYEPAPMREIDIWSRLWSQVNT